MGCGESKPPPMRINVHNYPGSQGTPKEEGTDRNYPGSQGTPKEEGADLATFKDPHSDPNPTNVSTNTTSSNVPEQPATNKPAVITEEERFNKTSEDHDVVLDDEESVSGTGLAPEVTNKEVNKQQSVFGREEQILQARQSEHVVSLTSRPEVASGKLWTDPDYPKSVAMRGIKDQVQWKRPKNFLQNPCLYSDGTCRYDIEQGSAGTCWFLSILQSLADQPEYLKHIIPEGSYRIGTPEYDGIFHCRFWKLGDWIDVYVDDNIPVEYGKPWGASSKTNPNELWVTLIEKAFSKLHGSYQSVFGGLQGHAFQCMTAGTSEVIQLEDIKLQDLYRRAKNGLACGSIIGTAMTKCKDVRGLVGNHGYSITAVCKVSYRSKCVSLIRIRNPWGGRDGEWNGPWSDGSPEWRQLSPEDKAAIQHTSRANGEFWMSFTHFFQHFGYVTVCDYTPDVDQDGHTDDMNRSWVIYGEWKEDNSGGWNNKLKNPKFEFEIPEKGIPKDGTPVVIDITQPPNHKNLKGFLLALKADLFRVESVSGEAGSQQHLLRELTTTNEYARTKSMTYRYPTLAPGKYLVVPHYFENGVDREFLLRIFSQVTLPCCEIKKDSGYFISAFAKNGFEYEGKMQETGEVETRHGAWVAGQNAGGVIGLRSAPKNPQYEISIEDSGELIEQPCSVFLSQDVTKPSVSIGFKIYKRHELPSLPTVVPMNLYWVLDKNNDCPANTEGNQLTLKRSTATANYMLMPGKYIILVCGYEPDHEASYILQIATKYKTNMKEYNVAQLPK